MLAAVAQYERLLIRQRLPVTFIAELRGAIDDVEGAIALRTDGGLRRSVAMKAAASDLRRGRDAITVLSSLVGKKLAGQTDLLATWALAMRRHAKPGGTSSLTDAGMHAGPAAATETVAA